MEKNVKNYNTCSYQNLKLHALHITPIITKCIRYVNILVLRTWRCSYYCRRRFHWCCCFNCGRCCWQRASLLRCRCLLHCGRDNYII